MRKRKPALAIIPLGGVGEIGKNMLALEFGSDIIVVDAGVAFPGDDLPGIDLVIPDIGYLLENKQKVRGIFVTHGHEDHIGALPYVLDELPVPVYATRLTLGLIRRRLEERPPAAEARLVEISAASRVEAGAFTVEFIQINHSIPDCVGLAIHTPEGTVIHTGDFKLDHTPVDGRLTELHRLTAHGERGVLALICDATGVENPGFTRSEKVVGQTFRAEFEQAPGRIIVATFASNVHRIQQAVDAARFLGRRVGVVGRSLVNVVEVARELGYLTCPDEVFVDLKDLDRCDPGEIVLLTTGSQGEPMAALTRIAEGSHRQIALWPGDTVIISASPIPGNARNVYRTINSLFRGGARVIYRDVAPVHVSGHASREELKLMLRMVKPRYILPFHGEYRHLASFRELALELGFPAEQVLLTSIGERLSFRGGEMEGTSRVQSGRVLIDGLGIGDIGRAVLEERRYLAENGIVIVVLTLDPATGRILAGPDILSRGFVYIREAEELTGKMRAALRRMLRAGGDHSPRELRESIRRTLDEVISAATGRKPVILPVILTVDAPAGADLDPVTP